MPGGGPSDDVDLSTAHLAGDGRNHPVGKRPVAIIGGASVENNHRNS